MTKYALFDAVTVQNPVVVFEGKKGYYDPATYYYGFGSRIDVDVDRYNKEILGLDEDQAKLLALGSFHEGKPTIEVEDIERFIEDFDSKGWKVAKLTKASPA
jgi:hypothetical protein